MTSLGLFLIPGNTTLFHSSGYTISKTKLLQKVVTTLCFLMKISAIILTICFHTFILNILVLIFVIHLNPMHINSISTTTAVSYGLGVCFELNLYSENLKWMWLPFSWVCFLVPLLLNVYFSQTCSSSCHAKRLVKSYISKRNSDVSLL